MSTGPNNPTEVLLALDRELDHEVSLVLYGRAALALGFDSAPAEFATTQDVDAIVRLRQSSPFAGLVPENDRLRILAAIE